MAMTIEPDNNEASATPWQILVVDDDVSVHVATELTLKGIRHRDRRFAITRALSGAQAVQAVQRRGISGYQFRLIMNKTGRGIVMVLTASLLGLLRIGVLTA